MTAPTPVPRLRLGVLLWLAGMAGAIAITATVLPHVAAEMPLPAPLWLIGVASCLQSGVLVALAVWAGVALAPAVGLRSPAFEAAAARRPIKPALRPQLVPGLVAGVAGGLLLFGIIRLSPAPFLELQQRFNPPLLAKMLYGGITEEVLLRWGLMTLLVWLGWRFLQGRRSSPSGTLVWVAIVISALVFGLGHLPAAYALLGPLTVNIVLFVIIANTIFGLVFGWLFWRLGLESAMIAHVLAHAVSTLVGVSWKAA